MLSNSEIKCVIKIGGRNKGRNRREKKKVERKREGGVIKKKKLKNDLGCCSLTQESFRLTSWCEYVSCIMKHL